MQVVVPSVVGVHAWLPFVDSHHHPKLESHAYFTDVALVLDQVIVVGLFFVTELGLNDAVHDGNELFTVIVAGHDAVLPVLVHSWVVHV